MYREKRIYSGDMLEVEIYPISLQERKQSRKKKVKESLPKQKKLNDKNARKLLVRLLNTNFINGDYSIVLSYRDDTRPNSREEAEKDVKNYIRRIKYYIKKNKLEPLKYIAIIEYREATKKNRGVNIHHHIVMNRCIPRDKTEELWNKGRVNSRRLQGDEYGFEALGRYVSKDPKGNKRWSQSKNLKRPTIRVNDYKYSKKKVYEIASNQGEKEYFGKLYNGYFYTSHSVDENEEFGGTYIYIKMRRLR